MSSNNELTWLDATAQAELVRTKELKPIELVEAAIERIERVNPQINAVIHKLYDEARATANNDLPDGAFKGVPFLLKNIFGWYAGAPNDQGSAFVKGFIAPHDSTLVQRYKQAGLVVCGITNAPEFGILPTTEPQLYGATRNPWNLNHSTGGSSGGSAAAVAAGLVPFAHANDGGGSIRIPASCCGLVGLKPTRARNPLGPDFGDVYSGLIAEHAVTRSVRDCAALLDATAGPEVGDPYCAPAPARPFLQEVGASPGRLRIAFTTSASNGADLHPDVIAATLDAAKLCESLGHEVEKRLRLLILKNLCRCLWCYGRRGWRGRLMDMRAFWARLPRLNNLSREPGHCIKWANNGAPQNIWQPCNGCRAWRVKSDALCLITMSG